MASLHKLDELNTPEYEAIDYEEWFGVLDIPEEDKEKRVELAEEIDDTYYNFFALVATMIALKKYLDWDYLTEYIETRLDEVVDDYGHPYLNEYARASAENTVDVTLRHQGEEYYLSAERASMLAAEDAQTIANYTELQQAISEGKNVKIWKTKNDNKVRDSHEIVNGKRVGILKPFSVGQSLLQFPRDFENAVSMRDVARCRCCLRYDYDPKFEEVPDETVEKSENGDKIKTIHTRAKNSELKNGLPKTSTPNSIMDKTDDDGKVLQRRVYDDDGKAKVDYDTSDHGLPHSHPTGAHKHRWDYTKERARQENEPLTEEELKENSDIIKKGVNYHEPE